MHSLHILFPFASFVFLPLSCSKTADNFADLQQVNITVSAEDALPSKAGDADEAIETMDVFFFRENGGMIENHMRTVGSSAVIPVRKDINLKWVVIANAPEGFSSSIRSYNDMLCCRGAITDNLAGCVMCAEGFACFNENSSLVADLDRAVSRVCLRKVTSDYYSSGSFSGTAVLDRVFLINVAGDYPYIRQTGFVHSQWYNMGMPDNSLPSEIMATCITAVGENLTSGSVQTDVLFECCPNVTEDDIWYEPGREWSARHTRLVIEATIDGHMEYYPITLPRMEGNHTYQVNNLVITGPGTSDPDTPVVRNNIKFDLLVQPWGTNDTVVELN